MISMRLSEQITFTDLHHAYVIEASTDTGTQALRVLVESFGISTKANPDFHEYVVDVFLLEHAHMLRREQSMHGAEGAKKIFLIAFNTILSEAQNALLKTLEEPTEGTHFFFVTRTSTVLLPTLLSRMQVIATDSVEDSAELGAGERFCQASVSERMNMIEQFIKAKPEEKPKAKEETREFLESLERALYKKLSTPRFDLKPELSRSNLGIDAVTRSLENVLSAKRTLSERSPSVKLLLEHLALTAPKVEKK